MIIERVEPHTLYNNLPCSFVAILCAMESFGLEYKDIKSPLINKSGYCTLNDIDKAIRYTWKCRKIYFKKQERKTLQELQNQYYAFKDGDAAIVCVRGHYIFIKGNIYYSFFDNLNDEVVCVWYLEGLAK